MALFFVLQIVAVTLIAGMLIALYAQRKWPRRVSTGIATLFIGIVLTSIAFGDAAIDYKFYSHFNLNAIREAGQFYLGRIAALVGATVLLYFIIDRLVSYLHSVERIKHFVPIGLLSMAILWLPKGIASNLYELSNLHFAQDKEFAEALDQLEYSGYVSKQALTSKPGKNIVFLALESLEASFLEDQLKEVTPHLRQLGQDFAQYRMKQHAGSDYTISALYTYLTGVPFFFKNHGNEVFGNVNDLATQSVGHILKKAGYTNRYLLGNPNFASMGKMLNLLGFDVRCEADLDPKYTIDNWGLHDKDLFMMANQELDKLIGAEQPFALFVSTISTHHPEGVFDIRMAQQLGNLESDLETMAHATDWHVHQLIEKLKKSGQLDNTVFYIVPDHLLMGQASKVLEKFPVDRELFLITNADLPSYRPSSPIYQLDIAQIILEGAGVQHNHSFLNESIKGSKSKFITNHTKELVQFSEATLSLDEPIANETKLSALAQAQPSEGRLIIESVGREKGKARPSKFYFGLDSLAPKPGFNLATEKHPGHFVLSQYNPFEEGDMDELYESLKTLLADRKRFYLFSHDQVGDYPRNHGQRFVDLGFSFDKIWPTNSYIAISDHGLTSDIVRAKPYSINVELTSPQQRNSALVRSECFDPQRMIAHAGGGIDGKTYTNSIEALDLAYANGFRLFEIDIIKTSDGHYVAGHDWNAWKHHTGYEGDLPPDKKTYKQYKYYGKYTMPTMTELNRWFGDHPDATLVSDKVNNPEAFVPIFDYPDRLMMEVFSLDAYDAAVKAKIKGVILSQNVLDGWGADKIDQLKQRNVEYVAVSRRDIEKNKELFTTMKEEGIKVFAFHINHDALKDDAHGCRETMAYCYGMYSDFLVLNQDK